MATNFNTADCETTTDDWLLWQLADSAFPTGGFAHSGGLEAAWQHKEVQTSAELREFVEAGMVQLLHGMLPFMIAAYETHKELSESANIEVARDRPSFLSPREGRAGRELERGASISPTNSQDFSSSSPLPSPPLRRREGDLSSDVLAVSRNALSEWDRACDSFLTNHVANRASRLQGRALLAAAKRIFDEVRIRGESQPEYGHLAPVFGYVMCHLNIERQRASRLFLFWHLRGWLASAVRLGLIGPNEAQSMQHSLGTFAEEILQRISRQKNSAPVQTAPLLEIWQGAQDRLYSRLFQS